MTKEPLILIEEEDKLEDEISHKTGEEDADALSKLVAGDIQIEAEPKQRRPQKRERMHGKTLR